MEMCLLVRNKGILTIVSLHQSSVAVGDGPDHTSSHLWRRFDQLRAIKIHHNAVIDLCHNFIDWQILTGLH